MGEVAIRPGMAVLNHVHPKGSPVPLLQLLVPVAGVERSAPIVIAAPLGAARVSANRVAPVSAARVRRVLRANRATLPGLTGPRQEGGASSRPRRRVGSPGRVPCEGYA